MTDMIYTSHTVQLIVALSTMKRFWFQQMGQDEHLFSKVQDKYISLGTTKLVWHVQEEIFTG